MTNDPYIVARLTLNGPNYQGELHAMPYVGTELVDTLTDEAMHMLEPEFPAAEFICDTIQRISDHTVEAKVIQYKAKFTEIDHIWIQRAELEHRCYMVGLEMGLS